MEFRYYVNEEKGIVIAKINGRANMEFADEYYNFLERFGIYSMPEVFSAFMKKYEDGISKLTGKAKCNYDAGDHFDINIGESIAKDKLMKAFERYRIIMYSMIIDNLNKICDESRSRIFLTMARIDRRDERLTDL